MRRRKEKYWETDSEKNITKSGMSIKSYFTGNINVDFDATYFKVDASSLNFIYASKKCKEILNLNSVLIDKCNFFEYLIENIHENDLSKIETYLSLVQQEKDFTFSELIKLRGRNGLWKDIYLNIVVGIRYPSNFPEQLWACVIDLTEQFNSRQDNKKSSNSELELISTLSKREKEITKLIVRGYTDKEIGIALNISYYTADTHRKNIINKLKVKNTACLAFMAGKIGIF